MDDGMIWFWIMVGLLAVLLLRFLLLPWFPGLDYRDEYLGPPE